MFDIVDRRQTHMSCTQDWRWVNGNQKYVGERKGWYLAPSIVEDGEVGTRPRSDPSEEVVYVIHASEVGRVKIGRTKRIRQRLEILQAGSPVRLKVVATFGIDSELSEKMLHDRYSSSLVHGEWFSDEILPDLLAFAERL